MAAIYSIMMCVVYVRMFRLVLVGPSYCKCSMYIRSFLKKYCEMHTAFSASLPFSDVSSSSWEDGGSGRTHHTGCHTVRSSGGLGFPHRHGYHK